MAARRQQRLVSLVLCLLSTRQFISAERIRQTVEGYEVPEAANPDEAFKRSFERDKAELRELGVPLETGRNSIFDTEDGYRIARQEFELPPIEFAADEAAAIGLASRLWASASLAPEARNGLLKLRAAGVSISEPAAAELLPSLPANEPGLPLLLGAVAERRAVQFSYRKPAEHDAQRRSVEPWGVLSWRGRWYVVGYDRSRRSSRSFRLDRVVGDIKLLADAAEAPRPDQLNMLELVRGANNSPTGTATVRVATGRAGQLRRMARSVTPGEEVRAATGVRTAEDAASAQGAEDTVCWEELLIDYRDTELLAGLIAAAGADAVVSGPPELVAAVVALLTQAASR